MIAPYQPPQDPKPEKQDSRTWVIVLAVIVGCIFIGIISSCATAVGKMAAGQTDGGTTVSTPAPEESVDPESSDYAEGAAQGMTDAIVTRTGGSAATFEGKSASWVAGYQQAYKDYDDGFQQGSLVSRSGFPPDDVSNLSAAYEAGYKHGHAMEEKTKETKAAQAPKPAPKPAPAPKPKPVPAPKPKPAPKPAVPDTMGEGTLEIGVDARAGRYKTIVPEDSWNCYWERLKDDRGGFDSIIANENVNPGARGSVTVKRGEFFNSHGCGTWTRQ